jgi:hypothetical protein
MKTENEKMVCALCGSENINEGRLLSVMVNCQTIIDDCHMGYCCEVCGDVVDIITEEEYQTKLKMNS